jgi:hypothetical protein
MPLPGVGMTRKPWAVVAREDEAMKNVVANFMVMECY